MLLTKIQRVVINSVIVKIWSNDQLTVHVCMYVLGKCICTHKTNHKTIWASLPDSHKGRDALRVSDPAQNS